MSKQDNIDIARSTLEAHAAGDLKAYGALLADNVSNVDGEQTKEIILGIISIYVTAFPDLRFDIHETIAEGNYVVMNWKATGTNTGPFNTATGNTIPPTGKPITIWGSTTFEIEGGKVAKLDYYFDFGLLMLQLGWREAL